MDHYSVSVKITYLRNKALIHTCYKIRSVYSTTQHSTAQQMQISKNIRSSLSDKTARILGVKL